MYVNRESRCPCRSNKFYVDCCFPLENTLYPFPECITADEIQDFGPFGPNHFQWHNDNAENLSQPPQEASIPYIPPRFLLPRIERCPATQLSVSLKEDLLNLAAYNCIREFGQRSEECVPFAVYLRKALTCLAARANHGTQLPWFRVEVGHATYKSPDNQTQFSWAHAWLLIARPGRRIVIIDGNLDMLPYSSHNVPATIRPRSLWGPPDTLGDRVYYRAGELPIDFEYEFPANNQMYSTSNVNIENSIDTRGIVGGFGS